VNPRNASSFCQTCGKPTPSQAVVCTRCGAALARFGVVMNDPRAHNKIPAGVCAIVIGSLGIHKFILGYTGAGITTLLLTICTCGLAGAVFHLIGIIEGIIYLTKSDDDFIKTYVENRRAWF
jgi:TM2 domain-containing membrane protein YozV